MSSSPCYIPWIHIRVLFYFYGICNFTVSYQYDGGECGVTLRWTAQCKKTEFAESQHWMVYSCLLYFVWVDQRNKLCCIPHIAQFLNRLCFMGLTQHCGFLIATAQFFSELCYMTNSTVRRCSFHSYLQVSGGNCCTLYN